MTTYRSYTIQKDNSYFFTGKLMIYPTDQGVQHDSDIDSDGYHYCGNCVWVDSMEEAKDLIDEKAKDWKVETFGPFPIGGIPQVNITKFELLSDAVKFAVARQGNLIAEFKNI